MMNRKLRFGVLGVGRIGKIHAGNLAARIPGAEWRPWRMFFRTN